MSTGDVRMPPTGSSARGKQQTAGAKSKPKSSQPKTKSLAKGRGRPRKSGKENARPSPPPTSDPSVSKDTTKALKRRRQSEEKDVNIVNMSSDLEPEPRKTRRAAKKVTYTEEGTSDNSDDSDFVATEPKNNNKPAKDTTRRNVCLSIKGGINVDIRTTKSKDDISSELQSMSPTKDNRVPFLSSKSRPDDRFSPKCGENVDFKARKSEVDEISSEPPVSLDSHSAAPPVSKILHNRNTTEHTPASPSAHALEQAVTQHSSHFEGYRVSKVERKTLDRLNDISDDLEEDGHPPVDEAVSKFDITPEKIEIPDDWSVIQEMLAVPASEGSRMALATVSKKRPAPPTPVYSPKAKRHKGDLLAEPLTTIAPPKILEDPNSPCPQTRVRQAAYMRPKVTAAKALNKEMEVRQQDRSGHDYGLTREATHNRAPAEVWTPTAHGIQRTSSDDSEAMLLLSSNSKPLPAPPTAESTAISGHSSRGELNVKEMNVGKASEENPFLRDTASVKAKSFVGRLTTSMQHSMKPGVQELVSVKKATTALLERDTRSEAAHDLDGDTLISEEHGRATNAFPILVKSSPPKALFSPSSHSSTSAQGEADRHAQYVFNPSPSQQELEDREWENSLKPHQRTIGAQLTRISRRVLRHIVDNETAVNDVAQTYAADAYTLFDRAQARRNEQFEAAVEEIKKSAGEVRMRLVWLAGKIRAEREGSARGM